MVCTIFLATNVIDEPVFWAMVGAGLGVYVFVRGFRILQRKRLLLNTPESKIRSASMGLVEISGQAVGPNTMLAPASQLECFYYHTIAWQLKQSGKSKEWVKVAEESLHVPFFIDDGTGRLLVDCNWAETDLHRDFHEQYNHSFFSSNDSVPDGVYQFLARHGVGTDHELKVDEYCIKPKNFLFVLGTLTENPGLELTAMPTQTQVPGLSVTLRVPGHNPDVTRTVSVSLGNSASSPMQITASKVVTEVMMPSARPANSAGVDPQVVANALMKAGITSPRAWAAAGIGNPAAARASQSDGISTGAAAAPAPDLAVNSEPKSDQDFDRHPKTVLMKGENDRAFFISWRSQKEVVASLGWKSALCIWGGPVLLLLCAYVLLEHFGAL